MIKVKKSSTQKLQEKVSKFFAKASLEDSNGLSPEKLRKKCQELIDKVNSVFGVGIDLKDFLRAISADNLFFLVKEGLVKKKINSDQQIAIIPKAISGKYYQASYAQKRIWFFQKLNPNSEYLNVRTAAKIRGEFNEDLFRDTLVFLSKQYEILRTNFLEREGELFQVINKQVDGYLKYFDYSTLNEKDFDETNSWIIKEELLHNFQLERESLWRFSLLKQSENSYRMIFVAHHIIFDGWSFDLFFEKLINVYNALFEGSKLKFEDCMQYKDYSEWEQSSYFQERLKKQEKYWKALLPSSPPIFNLPYDKRRLNVFATKGGNSGFHIKGEEYLALKGVCKNKKITLYNFFLAVLSVFLYKLTNEKDVIIGTLTARRERHNLDILLGPVSNDLAIYLELRAGLSFSDLLLMAQKRISEAMVNSDFPLYELERKGFNDGNRTFYRVVLQLLTPPGMGTNKFDGLNLDLQAMEPAVSTYDFKLRFYEQGAGVHFACEYDSEIFEADTIKLYLEYFQHLVKVFSKDVDKNIGDVGLFAKPEEQFLLNIGSGKNLKLKNTSLSEMFEKQVALNTNQVALISGAEKISYSDLGGRVNQVASSLLEKIGVIKKEDGPIAVFMDDSPETIISILAILSVGSYFMIIDPEYPTARIKTLFEKNSVRTCLCDLQNKDKATEQIAGDISLLVFEDLQAECNKDYKFKRAKVLPNSPAYVVNTSGTTGEAKSILASHQNVVNFISFFIKEFKHKKRDRIIQLTPTTLDASYRDIFSALLSGATLVLIDNLTKRDYQKIVVVIDNQKITRINSITPSKLAAILALKSVSTGWNSLRYVHMAGEVMKPLVYYEIDKILAKDVNLFNHYGPTEGTMVSSFYQINRSRDYSNALSIPAGRAIANTRIFILDKNKQLCPLCVWGEAYISGAGLSLGYIGNKKETKENFIEHSSVGDGRIYKTGDLARYNNKGEFEIRGRINFSQIKINGFRIELSEIELCLEKHEFIEQAIGVFKEAGTSSRDKALIVYYTTKNKEQLPEAVLRGWVLKFLPTYMLPRYFVFMEKFPLSKSGKVDRTILPLPRRGDDKDLLINPKNEVERKLYKIWQEVLGVKKIKRSDSFFSLGGHSLHVIDALDRINDSFRIVMEIKEVFNNAEFVKLSERIKELLLVSDGLLRQQSLITKAPRRKYYHLSHAQRRMFVLYKLKTDSSFFNINQLREIRGDFKINLFKKALLKVVARHEILRTNFKIIKGHPIQEVKKKMDFNLKIYDLSKIRKSEKPNKKKQEIIIKETSRPFKLEVDSLLRVAIIQEKEDSTKNILSMWFKYTLIISMHHIVSDDRSMDLFFHELVISYNAFLNKEKVVLPELSLQYRDYAEWEQSAENASRLARQETYWLEVFAGELPVLNLPIDKPRPVVQNYAGNIEQIILGRELVQRFRGTVTKNNTTLFIFLFSVFNVFLNKITGQDDLIVGSPSAERSYKKMENNIGLFVNTLAIRLEIFREQTFQDFLEKTNNKFLDILNNKDYPFEYLVEKINPERDLSRNPLFSVLFQIFQPGDDNNYLEEDGFDNVNINAKPSIRKVAKFDMRFIATETKAGSVFLSCEYNTDLFEKATIQSFLKIYELITRQVLMNLEIKITDIGIVNTGEQQRLLKVFNNKQADYPRDKVMHQIFEEEVEKSPNKIALEYGGEKLSYSQLNIRANQLAYYLRTKKGVGRETIVALSLERSPAMMISLLAILKAGGAYLPIDPEIPKQRLVYLLKNSGAKLLLVNTPQVSGRIISKTSWPGEIINLNNSKVQKDLDRESEHNLAKINQAKDLAYVIYTSGSTGEPKGVMIEQRSVINRLEWMAKQYKLRSSDKLLQKTSYTFDVSVWELFLWFFRGASLVMLKPKEEKDPQTIIKTIQEQEVTFVHFVPSMFTAFLIYVGKHRESTLPQLNTLRFIFASGEKLLAEQVIDFNNLVSEQKKRLKTKLINLYGPTEATVDVSAFDCTNYRKTKKVYIGKAIDNVGLYVLNQDQQLQPIGIPGELYIAGDCLARGYINDEAKTATAFLKHPFKKNARIYRTGDQARMHQDGNIEILGRIDEQLKLRGYRIEPAEIEANLNKLAGVKSSVVVVKNRVDENNEKVGVEQDKYLAAYYTSQNEKTLVNSELKKKLKESLPEYMIPAVFVHLVELPVNQNGKLDRNSLPAPAESDLYKEQYLAPTTKVEKQLAKIWQEVLQIDKIGLNDNFFNLGGHSLKAIQVLDRLNRLMKIDFGFKNIFIYPSLLALAQKVEESIIENKVSEKFKIAKAEPEIYIVEEI